MQTEIGELVDDHPRFRTVDAVLNTVQKGVHHDRFSVEYKNEHRSEVRAIAVQAYESKDDRNTSWAIRLDPSKIDDYITALEVIRHEYLGGSS